MKKHAATVIAAIIGAIATIVAAIVGNNTGKNTEQKVIYNEMKEALEMWLISLAIIMK